MMGLPYYQTSEVNAAFLTGSQGQIGQPGRYEDPDLWSMIGEAFAPLFSTDVRMQQDAQTAAQQGVGQPQTWWGGLKAAYESSKTSWTASTADFMGTVTKTWTDPDTGKFYFGSGEEVGKQFETTFGALGSMWNDMRGLFNTGYPADGKEPTISPMPTGTPATSSLGGGLGLLLIGLLILWGAKR